MLHLGGSTAPELTLKAYHSRVFLAFLAVTCETAVASQPDDTELLLCLGATSALAQWHLYLERCPRYLTEEQTSEMMRLSLKFLTVYKTLAIRHALARSLRFPMKPKLHSLIFKSWICRWCAKGTMWDTYTHIETRTWLARQRPSSGQCIKIFWSWGHCAGFRCVWLQHPGISWFYSVANIAYKGVCMLYICIYIYSYSSTGSAYPRLV